MIAFYSAELPRFGSQFCLLLTWALVHFLWQGFALAVAFAVVRRALVRQSANVRYAAGLVTLILMAACLPANLMLLDPAAIHRMPVAAERVAFTGETLSPLDGAAFDHLPGGGAIDHQSAPTLAPIEKPAAIADGLQAAARWVTAALDSVSVYAAATYAVGLMLMLTRVFVGLSIGHRLRRASTPVSDAATLEFMRRHVARLALRVVPAVAWCSRISVPVAVGVLRPMILLPTSLATGLTGRQLEYVLLHELAHIQRYDLVANLLERLIEVLLFFHPAVWWLTRQVRIERENACDDAVLRAGCQRAAYAEALLRVAELCAFAASPTISPAGLLAATGENPSQLARRIHRLFNVEEPATARSAAPTALALLLFAAVAIFLLITPRSPATAQVSQDSAAGQPATSSTDDAAAPNSETIVAGILARQHAWRSGSFEYRWGGIVAGESVGQRRSEYLFDGDRWKQTAWRGVSAHHNGCLVELISTPQPDGTTRSSLTITPDWLVAERKAGEIAAEVAARPPLFAGTLWREGEARFLAAHASAGEFLETRVVNGVETQVFEWRLTKADVFAMGSFPPSLSDGGKLRLFVSPSMKFVLPRVELLTPEGKVAVTYDGFDFQELAPGLFIPLRITEWSETFTLSNVSLANESPLPDSAFKIAIPVGTQVLDFRVNSPAGRHPGDNVSVKPSYITAPAQLEAIPELRDFVAMAIDEKAEPLGEQKAEPVGDQKITEIRVVGNEIRSTEQILNSIRSRVEQPLDQKLLDEDVRTLAAKKWFLDVRPISEPVDDGVRLTFEVVERPTLHYVKYLGNSKIKDKWLAKETELNRGSPLDPAAVEEGRRKIEAYYKSNGYDDVRVAVVEGTKPGDRGVIYEIDEANSEKIQKTRFIGTTIASGARLKTQIESKPPILGLFEGELDEDKINEHVDKLITYYRGLGFFRVRVSRQVTKTEGEQPKLTFVVDEGPRYRIRGVRFIGNGKLTDEQLSEGMALEEGDYYLRRNLDLDHDRLKEFYRTQGYPFASVQQELHFGDVPGDLTVVFRIEEGPRYRVRGVRFIGNGKLTDEQLRGAVKLKEGDYFIRRNLDPDLKRLIDLYTAEGYRFANIQPELEFDDEASTVAVSFSIKEADYLGRFAR